MECTQRLSSAGNAHSAGQARSCEQCKESMSTSMCNRNRPRLSSQPLRCVCTCVCTLCGILHVCVRRGVVQSARS